MGLTYIPVTVPEACLLQPGAWPAPLRQPLPRSSNPFYRGVGSAGKAGARRGAGRGSEGLVCVPGGRGHGAEVGGGGENSLGWVRGAERDEPEHSPSHLGRKPLGNMGWFQCFCKGGEGMAGKMGLLML